MSSQEPSAEDLLGWILASGGTSQDRAFQRSLPSLLVGEHSLVLICPFLWTPLDSLEQATASRWGFCLPYLGSSAGPARCPAGSGLGVRACSVGSWPERPLPVSRALGGQREEPWKLRGQPG